MQYACIVRLLSVTFLRSRLADNHTLVNSFDIFIDKLGSFAALGPTGKGESAGQRAPSSKKVLSLVERRHQAERTGRKLKDRRHVREIIPGGLQESGRESPSADRQRA